MKRRLRGGLLSQDTEESVNPLDGIANLADLMLVLAVGIMVALVVNWNVDIGASAYASGGAQSNTQSVDTQNAMMIDGDDIQQAGGESPQTDSGAMQRLGTVYYDEATGNYYIVANAGASPAAQPGVSPAASPAAQPDASPSVSPGADTGAH